jgi:hypothetical protein
VYGLGSYRGRDFGPIRESQEGQTQAAFINLMREFGVSMEDALNFPPLIRGFWGE